MSRSRSRRSVVRSGHRRLEFEALEQRAVLSGSGLASVAPLPLGLSDAEEVAPAAVLDALVQTLPYYRFNEVTAAQAPLLTLAQVASIPDVAWFNEMSPEARAALAPASAAVRNC